MPEAKDPNNGTKSKAEPTLSVCMIVKNEERFLPGCLESVYEVADEIIIVDTGSTDRTVEIAKEYGAKVYYHPWEDDFSKHRNQSISYATGDWILQIDADERLQPDSARRIKKILAETGPDLTVYFVTLYDRNQTGHLKAVFHFPRLFRNNAGVHYSGIVHNQVVAGESAKKAFTDLSMDHYGYDLPDEEMEKKFERTTRLLFKQLKENPEDPFVLYNLTNSYGMSGSAEEVVKYGFRTLEVLRKQDRVSPMYIGLYYPLINALLKLHRYEEAYQQALDSVKVLPTYIDGYYSLVRASTVLHRFDQVHEYAQRYFELRDQLRSDLSAIFTMNVYTLEKAAHVYYYSGLAYAASRQWQEAEAAFSRAFDEPLFSERLAGEFLYNLAQVDAGERLRRWKEKCSEKFDADDLLAQEVFLRVETPEEARILGALFAVDEISLSDEAEEYARAVWSYLRGDYETALRYLGGIYKSGETRVSLLIADIFERIGGSDDARRALEVAWRSSNTSSEVGVRLAELCIRRGEHAAALAVLQQLDQDRPNNVRVLLDLALTLWQQGAHEASVRCVLQVLQSSKLAPDHEVDSLGEMAERLCDLAKHFDGTTRLATARVAYELALAMSPGHHDAGIRLARLELRLGNPVAGVDHLMAVADKHPKSDQLLEVASAYERMFTQ